MAIGLSPDINLHWHASDGVSPAVGYKLYTYDQQTSALTSTYAEYTGTTPHSNPITLGTRGKVPGEGLWLNSDIVYTFVLTDTEGNSVDTIEGVSVSGLVGNNGADGADGSTWLYGDGIPDELLGEVNDYYINNEDGTYYFKEDTGWIYAGNLGGHQEQSDWDDDNSANASYIKNKPRIISDEEIAKLENVPDNTNDELDSKIDLTEKGADGGVATLDSTGKVPLSQLSGTTATVQEAYIVGSTPFASDWLSETDGGTALTPSESTIYYILTAGSYENKEYRWGGTTYIELSASLVLGETSSTAYRGDLGKIAYEHSQIVDGSNPHNTTAAGIGLGNVDNTSDVNKPISTATQAALTALDESVVHTTGDESINGTKTFNVEVNLNEGANFNSYHLPNGDVTPEAGQVLRFPTTGNTLEWGDAIDGESDVVATAGYQGGSTLPNPYPGDIWEGNYVISGDNGLLGYKVGDDANFTVSNGYFIAPEEGYYHIDVMAMLSTDEPNKIDSEGDLIEVKSTISTYIAAGTGGYYYASNHHTGAFKVDISCTSAGVVYLEEGQYAFGKVSVDVYGDYSPSTNTDGYIHNCSISVHKISGLAEGGGTTTGEPYSIPAFDANGDMISSTMLFKDNNYIDLGFEGNPNTPPASGLWNVSIGTDITYGAAANQNVILGTSLYNYGSLNEVLGDNIYNEASGCVIAGHDITNEESGRVIFGKNLTAAQCSTGAGMIFGDGDIAGGCAMIGRYADSTGSYGTVGQVLARNAAGELIWTSIAAANNYWTKDASGSLPVLRATNGIDWTGANVLELNNDLDYAPTHKEGIIYFDKDTHSAQMDMESSDVHLSIGRENLVRVYNANGAISNGDVIYLSEGHAEGDEYVFATGLAKADTSLTCGFVAVATQDIASGEYGEATSYGKVRGLDTSAFSNGATLYVSATTAGALTSIAPAFPFYESLVGKVMNVSATEGVIWINPDLEPQIGSGGTVAAGIETYSVALIDSNLSVNLGNTSGMYLSTAIIPDVNTTLNSLAVFVTQTGTHTGSRLGVYSRGNADVLLAQTALKTDAWTEGINTVPLTSSVDLLAGTVYMLAMQCSTNGTNFGYRTGGLTSNSPNHLARYDSQNAGVPTSTMQASVGYTQTGSRIWMQGA